MATKKKIVVPIYSCNLIMFETIEAMHGYICKETSQELDPHPENVYGWVVRLNGPAAPELLIWADSIDTSSHECAHVTNHIFHMVGAPPPTTTTDESFCYLLEYVFKQYRKFRKWELA